MSDHVIVEYRRDESLLRFSAATLQTLSHLRASLASLAAGEFTSIELSPAEFRIQEPLRAVRLRRSLGAREPRITVQVQQCADGSVEAEWVRTQDGWRYCLELLEGLVGPGHQFFNYDSSDDVEIEVRVAE